MLPVKDSVLLQIRGVCKSIALRIQNHHGVIPCVLFDRTIVTIHHLWELQVLLPISLFPSEKGIVVFPA